MEIKPSARTHGISDKDIRHALQNVMFVHYFDDYQMLVGPAVNQRLLEIAVNETGQIFHAMVARPKFLRMR